MQIKFRKEDPTFGFLSNFAPHSFTAGGIEWDTVEHFFQAMKTENPEERERIRMAPKPGKAKRLGRKAELRPDWEKIKMEVMAWALERKFRDPNMREALLLTNEHELIEDAPWDKFWGSGKDGKGLNMLGKLLIKLRTKLQMETT